MKKVSILFTILLMSAMTHAQVKPTKNIRFLALGDSYTIGESVAEKERWPVQLAEEFKKLGYECPTPKIIATTGWRTDQLKDAVKNAKLNSDYTLVSLLIGVNNQYQGKTPESYKPEFEELLNTAIKLAGGNKDHVFVVSIPDYGFTPFGNANQEKISKALDEYNAINKSLSEKAGVTYVNITDISRKGIQQPDLVAEDGLHPSGKMYREWVVEILKYFKK